MTASDDRPSDPHQEVTRMEEELSPEQAERVRRLLAEARHSEPVPADVAARLDRVLAGLATEQPEQATTQHDGTAAVVPLAQRRRRVGRMLLAAAAVVVGGVAVAQLTPSGGGEDAASDAGTVSEQGLQAPERQSADEAEPEASADPVPGAVAEHQSALTKGAALTLRPAHFVRDARRARSVAITRQSYAAEDKRDGSALADRGTCEPDAWGGGRYVPVRYGRARGWLVMRPPVGDTQVVDLFRCGDQSAARSATLPFR